MCASLRSTPRCSREVCRAKEARHGPGVGVRFDSADSRAPQMRGRWGAR